MHTIERLIDMAARELCFDRIELRRQNMIPKMNCPPQIQWERYTIAANSITAWTRLCERLIGKDLPAGNHILAKEAC